jgi:hypothetical protein
MRFLLTNILVVIILNTACQKNSHEPVLDNCTNSNEIINMNADCLDLQAFNYNPQADNNDGLCVYNSFQIINNTSSYISTDEQNNIIDVVGLIENTSACYNHNLHSLNRSISAQNSDIISDECIFPIMDSAFPNPFNQYVNIPITSNEDVYLQAYIIDAQNNLLSILYDDILNKTNNSILTWDGTTIDYSNSNNTLLDLPSGEYRVILDFGNYECFQNLKLLR